MPIPITMPRLSDTMEAGTIIKWNVKEGDKVSAGDVIADIETDKATMEMAVYDDGTVAKIAVPEGQSVGIGTTIAVLAGEGEDVQEAAKADGNGETPGKARREPDSRGGKEKVEKPAKRPAARLTEDDAAQPKPAAERRPETQPKQARAAAQETEPDEDSPQERLDSPSTADGRLRVSPVARRLADEHDIDLRSVEGSGPGGRIIKRDVLQAVDAAKETGAAIPPSARREPEAERQATREAPAARRPSELATRVPAAPSAVAGLAYTPSLEAQMVPLSNMRQIIAKRLVESKTTIPHYQVTATFNMDPLLELRATVNQQLESSGADVKVSVNDMLVRACAVAIHQHPEFNASWGGDHLDVHGDINIGIAISLPRERGGGLVVATIRNADQKGLRQISFESKMLADKARTRGLTIQEMSDATFTISNLGMFGVDNFTAIINPPNSAILAVGAAIKKPVVRPPDDQLAIGHEMSATLSCDHRIIDGAMAAQYLQTLRQLIENPATVLV